MVASTVRYDSAGGALSSTLTKGTVFILPGHADNVITLHLGYGRTHAGQVGTGPGFNAYAIRTTAGLWSVRWIVGTDPD